jgi:hypoxanthine-DNA glycosylase
MPGEASLRAGEYYAHARNQFWPFMGELVGAVPQMPYVERLSRLHDAGIALWDVLRQCERSGSLDSAIVRQTARPNDFAAFLDHHPDIRWVLFNGARAESEFLRFQSPLIDRFGLTSRRLPSTSPANASQRRDDKLREWREALRLAGARLVDDG